MKRHALCILFAVLLLLAGKAPAHGINLHAEADAAQSAESAEKSSLPKGEITVDMAALERMMSDMLDAKFAQQRSAGPELKDVIGGLGWILGLLGLAAYMKYRR